MKKTLLLFTLCLTFFTGFAQNNIPKILSERERATVVDELLEDKMTNLLPKLMQSLPLK